MNNVIQWSDESTKISKYFSAGEVTKGDPKRIPKSGSQQEKAILLLANELDKLREAWGSPLIVTSWYRPPLVNARVGGVSNSQHIKGCAVDIAPLDGDIYAFQSWCDSRWCGALGYGAKKGFVHLDMRNGLGFGVPDSNKGVRWNY
jgi:hypothetical protein